MLKGDHQVADETHFCSEKRIPAQKQTRKPCITAKPMEGRGDESKMGTATEQQPPPTANESTAPRESAVRAERRGGPRTAPAPSAARGMTAFRPPGEPQRSAAQPRAAPTPPPRAPERRNARIAAPLWGFSLELTPYGRTDAPRCAPGAEGERGGGAHRPHRPRPLRPPRATLRLRAPRPAPPPLPSPRGIEAALPTPPPPAAVPLPIPYSPFPFPAPRAAPPPHSQTVAALRAPFPRTEAAPHSPGPRNPPTPRSPPTCRRHTPPPDTRTPPVPVGGPPAHTHTHAERSRSAQRRCGRAPGGEGRRGAEGGWGGGWGGRLCGCSRGAAAALHPPPRPARSLPPSGARRRLAGARAQGRAEGAGKKRAGPRSPPGRRGKGTAGAPPGSLPPFVPAMRAEVRRAGRMGIHEGAWLCKARPLSSAGAGRGHNSEWAWPKAASGRGSAL